MAVRVSLFMVSEMAEFKALRVAIFKAASWVFCQRSSHLSFGPQIPKC